MILEKFPSEAAEYLSKCVSFAWSDKQTNWIREAFYLTGEALRILESGDKRDWDFKLIEDLASQVGERIQERDHFQGGTSITAEPVKS